jgi:hypothetical protein
MQNTTQNRKALVAQYFGQRVLRHPHKPAPSLVDGIDIMSIDGNKHYRDVYLELRNLSSITPAELMELAIFCKWEDDLIKRGSAIVELFTDNVDLKINLTFLLTVEELMDAEHWLRSRGFAIRYNGLSVEGVRSQVSYGWVQLKDTDKDEAPANL